jgi:hypothetical protein
MTFIVDSMLIMFIDVIITIISVPLRCLDIICVTAIYDDGIEMTLKDQSSKGKDLNSNLSSYDLYDYEVTFHCAS